MTHGVEISPLSILSRPAAPETARSGADLAWQAAALQRTAAEMCLPEIGTTLRNVHGLEFEVQGYHQCLTELDLYRRVVQSGRSSLLHGDRRQLPAGDVAPGADAACPTQAAGGDLYPVLFPLNLSARLLEFIDDADHCTPKRFLMLDTCTWLPGRSTYRYGQSIDHRSDPELVTLFVDGTELEEVTLAHEIGHAYLDFVLGVEDHRMYRDLADQPAHFQVSSVQSAVLDLKVNQVIKERGFSLRTIAEHITDGVYCAAAAVHRGFRPPTSYEAAWLALCYATALVHPDLYQFTPDQRMRLATAGRILHDRLPEVGALAPQLSAAIHQEGWDTAAQVCKGVDACLELCFAFSGRTYVPESDLIDVPPNCMELDKFSDVMPGMPSWAKYGVYQQIMREGLPKNRRYHVHLDSESRSVTLRPFTPEEERWVRTPQATPTQAPPRPGDPHYFQRLGLRAPSPSPPHRPSSAFLPGPGRGGSERTYGPGMARFLSRARLAEAHGLPLAALIPEHPYTYAANNPVTYAEPAGTLTDGSADPWTDLHAISAAHLDVAARVTPASHASLAGILCQRHQSGCQSKPVYLPCAEPRRTRCRERCKHLGGIHWCTDTHICGRFVDWGCQCRKKPPKKKPTPPTPSGPRACSREQWIDCRVDCFLDAVERGSGMPYCVVCTVDPDGTVRWGCSNRPTNDPPFPEPA